MRTYHLYNHSVSNCREVPVRYTQRDTAYVIEVYAHLTASCRAA